jgi:DNA-binding NtrC family response regulator
MVNPRPQKLLIIDEINYTRLVLSQALTNNGYKVNTAQNSSEAMQHIAVELPNVIIISLRSTDSGASTLRNLKDYFRLRLDVAQGAEPPIIVISQRDAKQLREVQALGISQSISTPINIQELFDSVISVSNSDRIVNTEKRMKIILLDGEVRSQRFLKSILTYDLYEIEAAESEHEFLAKVGNRKYDLSIMDLTSFKSEISGVLKNTMEVAEGMPVITIATSGDQISQDELKQFGVHMHFIKPLDVEIFRIEVDELLLSQESLQDEPEEQQEETVKQADQESNDQEEKV